MSDIRIRQRTARFGGEPAATKTKADVPSALYGVWASATERLLRYECKITGAVLVALYEDPSTCQYAIEAARSLERVNSIARPRILSNRPVTDERADVLGWTQRGRKGECGQLMIKPVSIAEVEKSVLANHHGWDVRGAVVFRAIPDGSKVCPEIARVMFR